MGHYKVYFGVSGIILGLAIYSANLFFFQFDYEGYNNIKLLVFLLGIMQMAAGLCFIVNFGAYPNWFQRFVRMYWRLTIAYFVVYCLILEFFEFEHLLKEVWLFGVPWFIAAFQLTFVFRLYRLKVLNSYD